MYVYMYVQCTDGCICVFTYKQCDLFQMFYKNVFEPGKISCWKTGEGCQYEECLVVDNLIQ